MTARHAPELTDTSIERMLRDRAQGVDDTEMTNRVMAAIAANPRRATRPWIAGVDGPFDRRMVLIAAAVLLLVAAMLAVGAALLRTNELVVVLGPTPSPASVPDRTVAPTAVPTAAPATLPGEVVAVREIPLGSEATPCCNVQLTSDAVGWLVSGDQSTARRFPPLLYRTVDDGLTWHRIALPHGSEVVRIRPVDDMTVYLIYDASAPVAIDVTHDGGATWTEARIDETGDILLRTQGDTAWMLGHRLWRSIDGGRTWANLGPARTRPVFLTESEGAWTGALGWGYLVKADGQPFDNQLAISIDGGLTWQRRSFPIDDLSRPLLEKWVGAGRLTADGRILLEVQVAGNDTTSAIYGSTDAGQTWQRITVLPPGGPFRFLDDDHWLIDAGNGRYAFTADGGRTWQELGPGVVALSNGRSLRLGHDWSLRPCADTYSRMDATPDPRCPKGAGGLLVETFDGGVTWAPLASR